MISGNISASLRVWLINLFINSIKSVSKEEDREEILRWLDLSRQVIDSDKSAKDKFTELYALMDAGKTARIVLNSVVESIKNYKNADLPLAVKVSVPLTLLAAPMIGGQGAGVAALGSAIGVPALVLIFLGSAGITSIIDAFVGTTKAKPYLAGIIALMAYDQVLHQIKKAIKNGTQGAPRDPVRMEIPEDEKELRSKLLSINPIAFEDHIMWFFKNAGWNAAATKPSKDGGIDGFAKHPDGRLIVVQCKRYASENTVGSPYILQFWGAIEQNKASHGYFVTTSCFTADAVTVAKNSKKIILVGMEELVFWHKSAPTFNECVI